jgi:hypothetical protein
MIQSAHSSSSPPLVKKLETIIYLKKARLVSMFSRRNYDTKHSFEQLPSFNEEAGNHNLT